MYLAIAAARRLLILPQPKGVHGWNKLTFVPWCLCECLWMFPWVGRFFLFPNLKIPYSVDNWGMGAVFPEKPRRCFLKRKASCCIHTGITWQFPNFSSVDVTLTETVTNMNVMEAATLAACADEVTTTAAAPVSRMGGCRVSHLIDSKYTPSLMTSRILIEYTSVDRSAMKCSTFTLYTEDRQHT